LFKKLFGKLTDSVGGAAKAVGKELPPRQDLEKDAGATTRAGHVHGKRPAQGFGRRGAEAAKGGERGSDLLTQPAYPAATVEAGERVLRRLAEANAAARVDPQRLTEIGAEAAWTEARQTVMAPLIAQLTPQDLRAIFACLPIERQFFSHIDFTRFAAYPAQVLEKFAEFYKGWTPELVDEYMLSLWAIRRAQPYRDIFVSVKPELKRLGIHVGLVEAFVKDAMGPSTRAVLIAHRDGLRNASAIRDPVEHLKMMDRLDALFMVAPQPAAEPAQGRKLDMTTPSPAELAAGERLLRQMAEACNAVEMLRQGADVIRTAKLAIAKPMIAAMTADDMRGIMSFLGPQRMLPTTLWVGCLTSSQQDCLDLLAEHYGGWDANLVDAYMRCIWRVNQLSADHMHIASNARLLTYFGKHVSMVESHARSNFGEDTRITLERLRERLRSANKIDSSGSHMKMLARLDALLGGGEEAGTAPFQLTNTTYVSLQPHPAARVSDAELLVYVEEVNRLYPGIKERFIAVATDDADALDAAAGAALHSDRLKQFRQIAFGVKPTPYRHGNVALRIRSGQARPISLAQAQKSLARAETFQRPVPDWSQNAPPRPEILNLGGADAQWKLARHLMSASSSTPTDKWLKAVAAFGAEFGQQKVRDTLKAWVGQILDHPISPKDHKDSAEYAFLTYIAGTLKAVTEAGFSQSEASSFAHLCESTFPARGNNDAGFAYQRKSFGRSPYPYTFSDTNGLLVKGAVWALAANPQPGDEHFFGAVAEQLLQKLRGGGIFRSLTAANACLWALGQIASRDAVVQMGRIRRSVRDNRVSNQIEKAMREAAEKAGLTVAELEEMAVPDFGLGTDGVIVEDIDGYTVELKIADGDVVFECLSPTGKPLKTVPADLRKTDAFKELREAADEIGRVLPVQKERIEQAYLQRRSWDFSVWKERYIDHPIVGATARRLIWNFDAGSGATAAIWRDGQFLDANGEAAAEARDGATVTLWHPIEASAEAVAAWRCFVMSRKVRQPFKQAHRELYLLTDAERATDTYSNRFAAHILKQHQYMALAKTRGWTCRHRMWVDAPNDEPTKINMPAFGLWAEIFVEGAGGDDPDVVDSGAYVYVNTDQMRFHRGAECVRLEDVPPIVFSEVMRDCDLFVGVASIGTDPNWINRGAEARRPNQWERAAAEYWNRASFVEMAEGAKLRRELVSELLPSLSIAPKCEVADKYLRVQGKLRAYRIHFNSSNILMEPDDKYLCIVPSQTPEAKERIFVPFDGDRTLSIIISKALMLAADDKIKDPSILRQINGT